MRVTDGTESTQRQPIPEIFGCIENTLGWDSSSCCQHHHQPKSLSSLAFNTHTGHGAATLQWFLKHTVEVALVINQPTSGWISPFNLLLVEI
jgi:hypothetical protein